METFRIFIVEDNSFYGAMLQHYLEKNPDYEVHIFTTGKDCLKNLYLKPSFISLDYSLPDLTGMEVLRRIRESNPHIPIVILSGQENITTAIELLKAGAHDYIEKHEDAKERLWNVAKNLRERDLLKEEISYLRTEIGRKYNFSNAIKGNSSAIKKVFSLMEKAVDTNISISVQGETGTGKELVAKAIHYNSKRKDKPFVALNVSAIPATLIESELFGHEKGAFTDAVTRRIGRFEQAHSGTIFLDEITEMDLNMQSKLLRVLQERELNRVGGNENIKIDIRLIVATNKNLEEEVDQGNFRKDLYYRLLGLPIHLPPLRDRGNDVLILAKFFIAEFCKENQMQIKTIGSAAKEKLMSFGFPGNVRELKALMELAVVLSDTNEISEGDISFISKPKIGDLLEEEHSLATYQRKIIRYYLDKYGQNVLQVAKKLDVGKSTIYRMLKNQEV